MGRLSPLGTTSRKLQKDFLDFDSELDDEELGVMINESDMVNEGPKIVVGGPEILKVEEEAPKLDFGIPNKIVPVMKRS